MNIFHGKQYKALENSDILKTEPHNFERLKKNISSTRSNWEAYRFANNKSLEVALYHRHAEIPLLESKKMYLSVAIAQEIVLNDRI